MTRAESLATAHDALAWFKIPHTVDQVVGVWAESLGEQARPLTRKHGASNAELAERSRSGGGGGKGGHSDPTASAALWGEPDAVDDSDETLGNIDHALALMGDSCRELDELVSGLRGLEPKRWPDDAPAGTRRQAKVATVVAYLHHLAPQFAYAVEADPSQEGHVEWVLREPIAGTAVWLQGKCEAMWHAARGEQLQVAEQKKLTPCSNCGPWRTGNMAVTTTGLCNTCDRFQDNHGALPTEACYRWWEHSRGTPPRLVIEAKAIGKTQRRKRA